MAHGRVQHPSIDHLVLCKSIPSGKWKAEEDHIEAPTCNAPWQTLPKEGHDDNLRFAGGLESILYIESLERNHDDVAARTVSMSDKLYRLIMFIPVQEADNTYYESLGFDKQADRRCWERFLFEDKKPPCAPPATAASYPAHGDRRARPLPRGG
ncbi:hypothetical protein ABZP36_019182 [Zizania latifolia]